MIIDLELVEMFRRMSPDAVTAYVAAHMVGLILGVTCGIARMIVSMMTGEMGTADDLFGNYGVCACCLAGGLGGLFLTYVVVRLWLFVKGLCG